MKGRGLQVSEFLYYASFVPGMEGVVEEIVRGRLPEAHIRKLSEGAILFQSSCTYDRLNFFCFNNIFAVISLIENPPADTALEQHMRRVCAGGERNRIIGENVQRIRSFRIVTFRENKPVPVPEKLKRDAEAAIARQSALRVSRALPDTEFWFLYRREGYSLFMKRLTKHPVSEKTRFRGELSPQLAYMLCRMSEPKHTDTVADPFCGYGSILAERMKHFPLQRFYAFDIDEAALGRARKKIPPKLKDACTVQRAEFHTLPGLLPEESLDAIITDPPWGMYAGTEIPLEQFYRDMIAVFTGLLKKDGLIILLSAREDILKNAAPDLEIVQTLPVLVSGKKARVFKFKKIR
ncbi:MAG: methyltransferase [Treponema sp.]|jgi:SAM-dependent methyltransferase|nr:methyltransferase [Treponema sp.]